MTQHQDDPAIARDQLLARLQKRPEYKERWGTAAMARRIAKMSDRQVYAALAMSDEEIVAAGSGSNRTPEYAPPTDETPVILWDHVDRG